MRMRCPLASEPRSCALSRRPTVRVVCSLLSTGRGSDSLTDGAYPYRKNTISLNKLCRRFKLCPKHLSVAHLHMCDAMCDSDVTRGGVDADDGLIRNSAAGHPRVSAPSLA